MLLIFGDTLTFAGFGTMSRSNSSVLRKRGFPKFNKRYLTVVKRQNCSMPGLWSFSATHKSDRFLLLVKIFFQLCAQPSLEIWLDRSNQMSNIRFVSLLSPTSIHTPTPFKCLTCNLCPFPAHLMPGQANFYRKKNFLVLAC